MLPPSLVNSIHHEIEVCPPSTRSRAASMLGALLIAGGALAERNRRHRQRQHREQHHGHGGVRAKQAAPDVVALLQQLPFGSVGTVRLHWPPINRRVK